MIKVNGKAVGFATCIEYKRQITALDERLFEVFCKVTGSELRTHMSVNQYRTHGYEFFITEMLSERVNPRYVEERLKQAGLKLKRDLHVLVASFKDEKSRREYQMEYFKMMLHEAVSDGYCVVYGNSLVVLISNDPGKTFSASSEENTREMLESCGMVGGLSHRFRGIENLHAHYEQACQAIDLGRRLGAAGSLFAYSDVYFFHMLDLIRQSGDLEEYCSPRLFDVIEYDAEYGTNYAITAHEYLKANGLPMLAAKQMDVHRNTIDYRIKRLRELFGIDFNDSEAVFSLTLSFKILRFLGKPPFDNVNGA
jgi:sugar diacid utilization regulator